MILTGILKYPPPNFSCDMFKTESGLTEIIHGFNVNKFQKRIRGYC